MNMKQLRQFNEYCAAECQTCGIIKRQAGLTYQHLDKISKCCFYPDYWGKLE